MPDSVTPASATRAIDGLIEPYGGALIDLRADRDRADALRRMPGPSVVLDETALCDLELLANGAFSPLVGFMRRGEVESVCETMRLPDGTVWPIPVCLRVRDVAGLGEGMTVGLRNVEGVLLGIIHVEDVFRYDVEGERRALYGEAPETHPGVAALVRRGEWAIGGRVEVVAPPPHADFLRLRLSPAQVRARLAERGWANVLGVHTQAHLSRVHETWMTEAARAVGATLLVHPAVGAGPGEDLDAVARVRGYEMVLETAYHPDQALLALLPLAGRWAGAREALWHALIRRNFGCRRLLALPHHGEPSGVSDPSTRWAGADLITAFEAETGVSAVRCLPLVVDAESARPGPWSDEVITPADRDAADSIPAWMARPEIIRLIRRVHRPRHEEGCCLWLTGLSGSGKSTLTKALLGPLYEYGRRVTLLDGDEIRTHLSKGLGFSKEDRDTNIRRVGFVAAQVVRHGGLAICACISPYRAVREEVRAMCGGRFIEIFCNTPLAVCAERDVKGLYARALRGEVKGVTGVDDPYEAPEHPELEYDSSRESVDEMVDRVIRRLVAEGYVAW